MGFPKQEYWSGLPFPFPGGSSWPRDQTGVSCTAGILFTTEPPGKPLIWIMHQWTRGFSAGSDGKESACSASDLGPISGLGRSPGEGNGYLLQHSCLENSMDRGAWQATVHGITKSQTWLSAFHFTSPINKVYQAETCKTVCCESVISKILIRCILGVGKPGRSSGSGLKEKVYCTTLRMTSESTQQQIHNCPRLTAMNNHSSRKWQLTWLQPPMQPPGEKSHPSPRLPS